MQALPQTWHPRPHSRSGVGWISNCLALVLYPFLPFTVFSGLDEIPPSTAYTRAATAGDTQALQTAVLASYAQGEYARAHEFARNAVEVSRLEFGDGSTNFAYSLDLLAGTSKAMGQIPEAVTLCERSLAIREKVLPADHPDLAWSLFTLAALHDSAGDYSRALDLANRSLAIREKTLGPDHPQTGDALAILARIYLHIGDYPRAIEISDRALAICCRPSTFEPYTVLQCLSDRALACADIGLYEFALEQYQLVRILNERVYGPAHPFVATDLQNLASIHADLGNTDEALKLYQRSIEIAEAALGRDHPGRALTLCNLAKLQQEKGESTLAIETYQQALSLIEKAYGPRHRSAAQALNGMALVSKSVGDFKAAEEMFLRSVDILEGALGQEHPDVATVLNNLASIYESQGRPQEAVDMYRRSLAIYDTSPGTGYGQAIGIRWSLALLHLKRGDMASALQPAAQAMTLRRQQLMHRYSRSTDRQAFAAARQSSVDSHLFHSACAHASELSLPIGPALGAFQLALTKALLEEVRIAEAAFTIESDQPTRLLREQRDALLAEIQRVTASPLNAEERDSRLHLLEAKLREADTLLRERNSQRFPGLIDGAATHSDITQSMPVGAALIDLVQYRRCEFTTPEAGVKELRYAVYLTIPRSEEQGNAGLGRVDLGEAAPIDEAVGTIARRMSAGQYAAKDLSQALERVSQLVYSPLAVHLTNVSHLIVCPDGQLSRLPFEMLSHEGRFLIEDKLISYVGSGREIVRLAKATESVQTNAPLVMGNPDFDLDLTEMDASPVQLAGVGAAAAVEEESSASVASFSRAPMPVVCTLSRDYRGLHFNPLPGAEGEAREAAKLLGEETVLRLGSEAREAELKSVVSPSVLHLSTHGFFLSDQEFKLTNSLRDDLFSLGDLGKRPRFGQGDWENPMIRCGLALAGANNASIITNTVAEDGLLTGLEAALLNLQGTELVILSACDTGSGDVKIGEGVMSLRRAFRIAGAQTVLASHWKVNDRATARLMTEFIRRWREGTPRGEAWHQAQLSLLRSSDFSNSYFWAAFTLTGQWR